MLSRNHKHQIEAFIGPKTEFTGELTFSGVFRLDGHFTGHIRSKGMLIVGPSGQVKADIDVDTVVVRGEVHGQIRSNGRVHLQAPARHYGNIVAPSIQIDDGVVFEGNCQMGRPSDFSEDQTVLSGDRAELADAIQPPIILIILVKWTS